MYTFICIIAIFSCSFASSEANSEAVQETLDSVQEVEIVQYPSEALEEKWTSKLERKGKFLNELNEDGSLYVIGSMTTMKSPGDRGFNESRTNAFVRAQMDAKIQIVRMMGEQVESGKTAEILKDLVEGEDPDAKQKATKMQKASRLVDQSLDKALAYMGVSDSEIANMNEGQKKVQYQESFSSFSKSVAASTIKGCSVVAVTEGKMGNSGYQMAVLMKYAPELRRLAAAIKSNKITALPEGKARNSMAKLRSLKPEQLIQTLGARVMYDKDGLPMVIGFGQQSYEAGGMRESQDVKTAQSQARLSAIVNIKEFVAEGLAVKEMQEKIEKSTQFSDGTKDIYSVDKFEQSIKEKATKLDITGAMTLKKWRGKHPLTGDHVAGVVVYWSRANRKMAQDISKEMTSPDEFETSKPAGNPRKTKDGILDDDFFDDDDF